MYKFEPQLKQTLWGGDKIIPFKHLDAQMEHVGESWEISGVKGNETIVANGSDKGKSLNQLVREQKGLLVGEENYQRFGDEFPLLIKFIDARQDLSIQVHPSDDTAHRQGKGHGKTEMWYTLASLPGAKLYNGLKKELTPKAYEEMVANDTITDALTCFEPQEGDVFFIPGGRIHAIGAGCFVTEIQQTSDTTYRIYDWDRIDVAGMRRELHVAQSVEAIDGRLPERYKTQVADVMNKTVPVVDCQYFVTNLLQLQGEMEKDYSNLDSFVILMPLEGKFSLVWENGAVFVSAGECVLVPNVIKKVSIRAEEYCKMLEIYCQLEEEC